MFLGRTWFKCSADEVLQRYTSWQIAEMQAAFMVDPWGERADDVRRSTAELTQARSHTESVSFDDFMPPFEFGKQVEQTPAEMRKRLRAALGGRFVDAKGRKQWQ